MLLFQTTDLGIEPDRIHAGIWLVGEKKPQILPSQTVTCITVSGPELLHVIRKFEKVLDRKGTQVTKLKAGETMCFVGESAQKIMNRL